MKRIFLYIIIIACSLNKIFGQVGTELPIIEDFEKETGWIWKPWVECTNPNSSINKGCAHSGKLGLNCLEDFFTERIYK